MNKNEFLIQNILYNFHLDSRGRQNNTIAPNIKVFGWESDLLVVSKSGISTAYEIKMSRHDLKNEFKNVGLKKFKRNRLTTAYNANLNSTNFNYEYTPNYYYIVITKKKICSVDELDPYTGLIYITKTKNALNSNTVWMKNSDKYYKVSIIKKAVKLHNDKFSKRNQDYLVRGLNIRYWNKRFEEKL